jgi:hypothetical protein
MSRVACATIAIIRFARIARAVGDFEGSAKAIIISWLVGVVCGVGMVIVVQRENRTPPASNASVQTVPQTNGTATTASPDGSTR